MHSRWLGVKVRKYVSISGLALVFFSCIFFYAQLKREYLSCPFWGCLGQNIASEQSLGHLRRHISAVLMKAANDVKWGRKETAFTDLLTAAALLDHAQELNSYLLLSNQLQWPSRQPGNLDPPVYPLDALQTTKKNLSIKESSNDQDLLDKGKDLLNESDVSSLVTIVLDECEGENEWKLKEKLLQIRQLWLDVRVVVGISKDRVSQNYNDELNHMMNISVLEVTCDKFLQVPLETLLELVTTPFVMVLKATAAITTDLSILTLLQVATDVIDAGVVGVAERGTDGAWDYDCSQIFLENSRLSLTEGYEYSRGSCIFCDVTSQSFLAATHILKTILPDSSLPVSARQIDWAIRLRKANILSLTCPDVMVHTSRNIMPLTNNILIPENCVTQVDRSMARDQYIVVKRLYRKLAQKWELTLINLQNKTSLEYSCLEIHFNCQARIRVRNYILPPCCLKIKHKMVKALLEITRDTLIPCHMTSGTLLGAVKFKDAIPWDFDDDFNFPNKSINVFKANKMRFREMGLSTTFSELISDKKPYVKHNYITMAGQGGFSFDLLGADNLNSGATNMELLKIPGSLPCLQYGHFPVHISSYLNEVDNITTDIVTHRRDIKSLPLINREILLGKIKVITHPAVVQFPPMPDKSCHLLSFVRIGSNWAIGPWNPGLQAKEKFGENLFKHRAHWRFEFSNFSWPTCLYPGHPMCLDIHPQDGSIPFI